MQNRTQKALPANISQIIPPIDPEHYEYFGPLAERPAFEPFAEGDISWANAWWLAEFSMLAYCSRRNIAAALVGSSFKMPAGGFISMGASQGFIAANEDAIVVAFRGTELPHRSGAILASAATWVESAKDWASNATFALVPFADGDASNTRVHSGFQAAYERMHSMVDVVLKDLLRIKLRPIWFTGHSLGGALATIAAARLDNATGLYTYGCPRVGDDDFVNAFPAHVNVWRFCTSGDPVPNVPPRAGWFARLLQRSDYQHLGHAFWLDENALPVETGELFVAQKTSNPLLHAPMRYCVLIWNLP